MANKRLSDDGVSVKKNYRLTEDNLSKIEYLTERLKLNRSEVIRLAIDKLYETFEEYFELNA